MPIYQAPVRDMQFIYHELLEAGKILQQLPGFEEASDDVVDAILEEGGKFCSEVLQPLNQSGDEAGCRFDAGTVTTPTGFPEAYRAYVENGWPSLACDPDYGGQGLPETLSFLMEEMLCAANVSFSLYPGLTRGAITALSAHASDELKQAYLPNMVEGVWTGTMCLTEPHSGTDLGLLRTKAEPAADGSYRITGTKIFITGGEQDLTDNIIHLVLARLPDAPPGVRGISLFLVPKFLLKEDGTPGERNGAACGSIEHKMGIKGSATCVMNFDDAVGYLVGPPNQGLACMFTMMNAERLAIGMQGLGLADVAYQNAVQYARDRVQGRALSGAQQPEKAADPILVHGDVRRMLLTSRAYIEGARALAVWTATQIDVAKHHPDAEARETADDYVALLTPVIKAFLSDMGSEVSNLCLQVLGGHGYIREWGMEQFVRDARIAQIYEGTNGVQAMDLVRRKLFINDGRLPVRFFRLMGESLQAMQNSGAMAEFIQPCALAVKRLAETTVWLMEATKSDREILGSAAVDYLRLFALTTLSWFWVRMAEKALAHGDDSSGFYRSKLATARFYLQRLLPQTLALEASIKAGSQSLFDLADEAF